MSGSSRGLKDLGGVARWTEREAWTALRAWGRSGQALKTFAREQGIPPWRLRWWSQKLGVVKDSRRTKQAAVGGTSERLEFVPAVLIGASAGTNGVAAVVVRLPDGIEIEFRDDARTSAEALGRLVAELRKAGA